MQLKQFLKLSQQLVMTPQLQQAIKLLQLSRMELIDEIQEQMLENPVMEEQSESDKDRIREDGTEIEKTSRDEPQSTVDGVIAEAGTVENNSEKEIDWEKFVERYHEYSYSPGAGGQRMNADDLPSIDQTLAEKTSLFDHLMRQIHLTSFSEDEFNLAAEIVGNINETGYFVNRTLEDLAYEHGFPMADAEDILVTIQEMEPVGVASRDLRECLLIQAGAYHVGDINLRKIISDHLGNMENRNYPAIMKGLGITEEELIRCARLITNIKPRPGRNYQTDDTHYITPDVYVHKRDGDYIVTLNEDGMPKLKISNFYRSAMSKGKDPAKDYIQDKFRSAVWLIRSIHQRQNTIRKVTESIVRFQLDFFDQGPQLLRPLILRDVADDIGMHESTVSRVTTNKYVHTPQGIFEPSISSIVVLAECTARRIWHLKVSRSRSRALLQVRILRSL